jgi:hypothetical protein
MDKQKVTTTCTACYANFKVDSFKIEGVYPRLCFDCWCKVCDFRKRAIALGIDVGPKHRGGWYKDTNQQILYDEISQVQTERYLADTLYQIVLQSKPEIYDMDIL